jgi:hypothetical protein
MGGGRDLAADDRQVHAFSLHDFRHDLETATAAGAGSAMVCHVVDRASTVLHAGSDLAVGDTVTVANDHAVEADRSLLKVIVKVFP